MNYRSAVAEAKRLIKRSEEDQWRLAELTSEILANGRSLREWATDIGLSTRHVGILRDLWNRWGVDVVHTRPRFADAYATTKAGSQEVITESQYQERRVPTRHEDKVEMARTLLSEPRVAQGVADVVAEAPAVQQAVHHRDRERAERLSEPMQRHEEAQRGTDLNLSRIIVSLINVRHTLNRNLDLLRHHDLDSDQRAEIQEEIDNIKISLGWMESFVKSGSRSFEDELDALLGRED